MKTSKKTFVSLFTLFSILVSQFASPFPVYAAGIIVNTASSVINGSDGLCTLPEAIIAANTDTASGGAPGECAAGSGEDTITFPGPGTIVLPMTLPDVTSTDGLTIDGIGGVILDSTGSHLLNVAPSANLTIEGLTIINAQSAGVDGGALSVGAGADITINNSTFSNNTASGKFGGAVYIAGSATANISNSTFLNNTVDGSSFGGAIYVASGATVEISDSTFEGNSANVSSSTTGLGGGAIQNVGGDITIYGSTFSGNQVIGTAGADGGAINSSTGTLNITNSTFHGNLIVDTAEGSSGGAIRTTDTAVTILHSTFAGNDSGSNSPLESGAVTMATSGPLAFATSILINNIFANTNSGGFDCAARTNITIDPSSEGNIIVTNSGVFPCGTPVTFVDGPNLGELGDNGGSTETIEIILPSDALDAAVCVEGIDFDQRGVSRPQPAGGNCDIGAYEYNFPPTVTITSGVSNPTNVSPIPVTITFGESVSGFDVGDITVGNGTAGNFGGSGTTYTADITPAGDGLVTVDVAADVAVDGSGTGNTAATQFTRTFDSTKPTVEITTLAPNPTNSSPISVTITFSEIVSGFAAGDLTVGNGTAGNFDGSGTTYTADITPAGDGTITVNVAADKAVDSAGNGNVAATQFSRTFDTTAPTVEITSLAPNPTNSSPISVTITFSESVSGFAVGDITVGNGTAGNFGGSGTTYTADITPAGDGLVTVDVAADKAVDNAGNGNDAAPQFTRTYGGDQPTVTITSVLSDPTNISPIPVTITFSESVSGFDVGDLTVGNGTAGNFDGSGTTYTADITPAGDGLVTVNIAADVATDGTGNGNQVATQFSRTFDATAPTVSITSLAPNPTNSSPISVIITFSEIVSGFAAGDLTVGNGTAGNFGGSGATYTADITPVGDGTVTVNVAADVAIDGTGNGNVAATQFSRTYDTTSPTLSITSLAPNPTNSSPISVTITFSESVSGFAVGDLTVGNGTAGNFGGSGTTYTADITPAGDGTVTVNVVADKAVDSAGNGNVVATQFSRTFDTTAPTVEITSLASNPTNSSPISVTITFSESVSGFAAGDITVGNGTAGNFGGSGTTYTADITPAGDGTVTVNVAADKAVDNAGNGNDAAVQFTRTFDSTKPTVEITSLAPNPTNSSPISVTITFSESVSGFAVGDLTVGNGTAGNFDGSGTTYTADITPAGDGTVTVNVAADKAVDSAGNGNVAATQFSRTFDTTAPTVEITSLASNPTNSSPISVTITFSESVSGFAVGDITVGNGTAGNFGGSGTTYTADITPAGDGLVTVDVAADKAVDNAGNGNDAAPQFTRTYGGDQPTVTITSVLSDPTNISPIPVTITFSESVSGFDVGDLTVGNGTAGNFDGSGTTYTADITPAGDGLVTVNIAADVATDGTGNGNQVATQFSRMFDATAPTVSITVQPADPTNVTSADFTFSIGGSPVDVDCKLDGDAYGACDTTTSHSYAGPLSENSHTFMVRVTDAAGNSSTDAYTWTVDLTPPTVTIDSGPADPTTNNFADFNFTASGDSAAVDCALDGGDYAACDTTTSHNIAGPLSEGTHTFIVRVTDAAGNSSTDTHIWDVDYYPVVSSITRVDASPTGASSVDFTVTFSEPVTGVDTSLPFEDFNLYTPGITGVAITGVSGTGNTYTVTVSTGSGNGSIRLDVSDNDTILDSISNPLGGLGDGNGDYVGASYTINKLPPPTLPPGVVSHARDFSTPFVPPSGSAIGMLPYLTKPAQQGQSVIVSVATPVPGSVQSLSTPQPVYAEVIPAPQSTFVESTPVPPSVATLAATAMAQPETTLLAAPESTSHRRSVFFAYEGVETGTFLCSLDGGAYFACEGSIHLTGLDEGVHVFEVRAVDHTGHYDSTPIKYSWVIEKRLNVQRYRRAR